MTAGEFRVTVTRLQIYSNDESAAKLVSHDIAQRQRIAELEQEVKNWRAAAGAMPVDRLMEK